MPTTCTKCGRPLSNPASIAAGMGPTCSGRAGVPRPRSSTKTKPTRLPPAGESPPLDAGREYFTAAEVRALLGREYLDTQGRIAKPGGRGVVLDYYPAAKEKGAQLYGLDIQFPGVPGTSPRELQAGGHRIDGWSRRDLFAIIAAGPEKGKRLMQPVGHDDGGPKELPPEAVDELLDGPSDDPAAGYGDEPPGVEPYRTEDQ